MCCYVLNIYLTVLKETPYFENLKQVCHACEVFLAVNAIFNSSFLPLKEELDDKLLLKTRKVLYKQS